MSNEHDYRLALRWAGATTSYAAYDRSFQLRAPGKPTLTGSADPQFRGDASLHNPEDLFVAAIASCHMLAYLALCARAGICVTRYADDPHGTLITDARGGGRFSQITLRPSVQIAPGSDVARALALHHDAHERCFIASSCSAPIACDPTVTVGEVADPPPRVQRQDLAVRLPHGPGSLAQLGELLGHAGVSLEGGGGFAVGDTCFVHFLVDEGERAAALLREAGFVVLGVRDVLELRLRQDEPGQLGTLARAMADASVNIECVYSDHDHRLVLVVDDLEAGRRVAASWRAAR